MLPKTTLLHSQEKPRHVGLDLLRAFAVFLVFGRHLGPPSPQAPKLLLTCIELWNRGGWVGVDVFFVLSGFLVSGLLFSDYQRNARLHPLNFLLRRGFKIYPPYYFYLSASFVLGRLFLGSSPTGREVLCHCFFVQNYDRHFFPTWGHLWSLALEEHFYILLAGIFVMANYFMPKDAKPFWWIPRFYATVAIALLSLRWWHGSRHPFNYFADILPTHLRVDSFLFGVLLSYYYHFAKDAFLRIARKYRNLCWVIGVVGLLPAFIFNIDDMFSYTFGFTLYYVASGALITALLATSIPARNPVVRIGAYVGARSYSIYLWHMLTFTCCGVFISDASASSTRYWIAYASCCLVFSVLFGIAISEIIEFPALTVRNALVPRPRGSAAIEQPTPSIEPIARSLPRIQCSMEAPSESPS